MPSDRLAIEPLGPPPDAVVVVPGSKSHTNRALVCAALADGRSVLRGALFAADTEAMMGALAAMGVGITAEPDRAVVAVDGGPATMTPGPLTLDMAQSGTTSRFLLAMACLGPGPYLLDGDPQLRARPFGPLLGALDELGGRVEGDRLPVRVTGGGLVSGLVEISGSVSSQFLSGLLLAAPYARGSDKGSGVEIVLTDELVSKPYVELTLATMASFGVSVDSDDLQRFWVAPQRYEPTDLQIEPDASAASYFFAAAAVTGGRVRVDGLGSGAVQGDLGFVDVLEEMGATVNRGSNWTEVIGNGPLRGVDVDLADMSDVAQTLAVTASFATSPTRISGIEFIENKETRRVTAMTDQLRARGIEVERFDGGLVVHPGTPEPGVVATYDDHRMAMSFALLGLVHPGIEIDDPSCVNKTFPRFFEALAGLRRSDRA